MTKAARRREFDVAIAGPTDFAELDLLTGGTAIATLRESAGGDTSTNLLGGAIICPSASTSITHVRDLHGTRFAAVDALELGGWMSAGREIRQEGMDPDRDLKVRFYKTPEAVADAGERGEADAGVLPTGALEMMGGAGRIHSGSFRVLPPGEEHPEAVGFPFVHSTRLYPQTAFAALPLGYQSVHRAMMGMSAGPYRAAGRATATDLLRRYGQWVLLALTGVVGVLAAFTAYVLRLNLRLAASEAAQREEFRLRTLTQERQLQSEARFHHLFHQSAVGICLTDAAGALVEANPALRSMVGYTAEELAAVGYAGLSHPEDAAVEAALREELLGGRRSSYELDKRLLCRNGETIWVHYTGSQMRDPAGGAGFGIGVVENITGRKQVEDERERLIGQLQRAMAEVKTLSGLLPICAHCKKIRNDQGYWEQVDVYLQNKTDVHFTHGICPECYHQIYPDFE